MDVARYFLAIVCEEEGDFITNLKLQKLLYYAQGFHLAILGSRLFDEEIYRWMHGPVVPEIYRAFKEYGAGPIACPKEALSQLPDETRQVLDEVFAVYGQFTAWTLRNMTHTEPPYCEARADGIISTKGMEKFFKTRLIEQ